MADILGQPVSVIKRELSFAEVIQQIETHYNRAALDRVQDVTSMRVAVACANAGKEGSGPFEEYRNALMKPNTDVFGRSISVNKYGPEDLIEGYVSEEGASLNG